MAFTNRYGQQIVGTFSPSASTAPGVLLLHGFRGTRTERHLRVIAGAIADAGIAVLRIDLSNNVGESEGEFRNLTVSHEVEDAEDALDFLGGLPQVDGTRLGISGHSVGGLVAALTSARRPEVAAVVTLSAVFDLHERFSLLLGADELARWKMEGQIEMDPPGCGLFLGYGFMEDAANLGVVEALQQLQAPLRIIQGEADAQVPALDAHRYMQHAASAVADLAMLPDADHGYRSEEHLETVCGLTAEWFRLHLLDGRPA